MGSVSDFGRSNDRINIRGCSSQELDRGRVRTNLMLGNLHSVLDGVSAVVSVCLRRRDVEDGFDIGAV